MVSRATRNARRASRASATAIALLALVVVQSIVGVVGTVTLEANVATTVNGKQLQGAKIGCKALDGQPIMDVDTVSITLTNGAVMPIKVDCRPPVYMFDLLSAGSVPQRVIPITIPLCDAPVNPYTGAKMAAAPEARRLARMAAAAMHMGHGASRNLANTVFRDWSVEDWHAYASGDAHLVRDLGMSHSDAIKLEMNITMVHYMHDMYKAAPGMAKLGMDAFIGTDRAMYPPFMRNLEGEVTDEWAYKVRHGTGWTNDLESHPRQRKLLVGIVMAGVALGMATANAVTIAENILPRLDNLTETLKTGAAANLANEKAINATRDFAFATRNMLNAQADALDSAEQAISGLQAMNEVTMEGVNKNAALAEGNAARIDEEAQKAFAARELLRQDMLAITEASQNLEGQVSESLQELRDFTIDAIGVMAAELEKSDRRTADVARKMAQDVSAAVAGTQDLALLMYKDRTLQQAKRDLTSIFFKVKDKLEEAGWRPFLWEGSPTSAEDAARIGQRPNPEDWKDGSIHRRVQLDNIQILFASAGQEGAGGAGTTNHVLHEHNFNIMCDARALMNRVGPWFEAKDIAKFVGPEQCMPLAPGDSTDPNAVTDSPNAALGQWTTFANGDAKHTLGGVELQPCTCWVEFTARTCTHGETTAGTNPFDRPGFDTAAEIGTDGLDSTALCTGTGASAPIESTTTYTELAAAGIRSFTISDILASPSDPGRAWYHAGQHYIQDWVSFQNVLEWDCGHERFVPFAGNPTTLGYKRTKFLADASAYAIITSSRQSGLYKNSATGKFIPFIQKVKSFADSEMCDIQNTQGHKCAAQPPRAYCAGCQACAADPLSLSLKPEPGAPEPPTNLAQAVYTSISAAWAGLVYNLADMESTLFGIMPADVSLTTTEFTYSPTTKTSFKCRLISSIYTLGGVEPLATQQLRSIHKYMRVRIDEFGNGDPVDDSTWPKIPGTGTNGMTTGWSEATSNPDMFNDASVFLESNMVWAGAKDCIVNECTSPDVFLASAGARIPTEQTRYTYNVPQGLLSTSPDPAGRIGSPTYIMSKSAPNPDKPYLTLNQWTADFPGEAFEPDFASASLHHYYMPLVKVGNRIQCAASLTAAMGPVCGLLDNYDVYAPTSDEYGDSDVVTECNKPDVICYRPHRFTYGYQFVIPQGDATQSFVSACPTLDTSAITKGVPTIYLTQFTTRPIETHVFLSGPGCISKEHTVTVYPSRRLGISVEVCGQMDIVVKRFNAVTLQLVDCGNEEAVDVQPPAEFGGDAANITYVQPITYVQSTDDVRLREVGAKQNAVLGDLRNLVASMARELYGDGSEAFDAVKANAPNIFNETKFGGINTELHSQSAAAALAENERVKAAEARMHDIKAGNVEWTQKADAISAQVNDTISKLKEDVDEVNALRAPLEDALRRVNETSLVAMAANRAAAESKLKAYNNSMELAKQGISLNGLGGAVDDLGGVVEDVAKVARDAAEFVGKIISAGLDLFGDILGIFGGGLMGIILTLMLPCIVAVVVVCLLVCLGWFFCKGNIKAGVGVVAKNPQLLAMAAGAPLGPAGMAAAQVAAGMLKANARREEPMAVRVESGVPVPETTRLLHVDTA